MKIVFNKKAFNKHFDKLHKIICYRLDPNWYHTLNNHGDKGEYRGFFSHKFNQMRYYAQDCAEAYVKHHCIFYLYEYVRCMCNFGESKYIGKFMQAPRQDWNIVNSTIGQIQTLQHIGLSDPIDNITRYDYKDHKKALNEYLKTIKDDV